jgi:hypothetical protein
MPTLASLFAAQAAAILLRLGRIAATPGVTLVNVARIQPVEAAHPHRAPVRIDEVLIDELHVGKTEVGGFQLSEILGQ